MERMIIVGTGQQSQVVAYNIMMQGAYEIVGYFDIDTSKWGKSIASIPILSGYKDYESEYLRKAEDILQAHHFYVALGNMKARRKLFEFFIRCGWIPVDIVHPAATVSLGARLGKGVMIEAGCLITPNPIIGDNVVINTGSQVNHDNQIADHVYIASGVILSGGVQVGEGSLIDDGVIVTLGKKVGRNSIIGAGSVVTKDIPDNVIAYGNPCRVIRDNVQW